MSSLRIPDFKSGSINITPNSLRLAAVLWVVVCCLVFRGIDVFYAKGRKKVSDNG